MKAFVIAVIASIGLAVGAAYVLDRELQRDVQTAFATSGVRL